MSSPWPGNTRVLIGASQWGMGASGRSEKFV